MVELKFLEVFKEKRMSLSRRRTLALLAGGIAGATLLPEISPVYAAAGAKYYIRLRTVELGAAAGVPAAAPEPAKEGAAPGDAGGGVAKLGAMAVSMAKDYLLEELKKRPEVVLELDGVPEGSPAERFAEELKRRKLKGYEVTLRIIKLDRKVLPPPAGRKFRMLEQSVKLSLVGTLYPGEPTLALGGDGESSVQIEVGAQISENQERDVLKDVLIDAISQAVAQALRKLAIGPIVPPKDPPRRRKK